MQKQILDKFSTVACALSATVLVTAGLMKLHDLGDFIQTLRRWGVGSPAAQSYLGFCIPLAELFLGACWLLAFRRRLVTWAMLIMIVCFTAIYLIFLILGKPPSCACFGRIIQFVPMLEQPFVVLLRNSLLMLSFSWFLWASFRTRSSGRSAVSPMVGPQTLPASRTGFTLIETLMVIALVSILIALILPQVAVVRNKTREIKMSSVVQSHAAMITQYSNDYSETFPYLTSPLASMSVIRSELVDVAIVCKYFDAAYLWHVGLADGYYNGVLQRELFGGRSPQAILATGTSVLYPASFLARPEYWNLRTRTVEPDQFAPTKQSDVFFPSAKALTTEALLGVPANEVCVGPCAGFVDGHGQPVAQNRSEPDGPPPLDAGHRYLTYSSLGSFQARFVYSLEGVRGRDLK